jgi:hypothetical protein
MGIRTGFALYLRPFRFDPSSFYKRCERRLTVLVCSYMPLVCLDAGGTHIGAGRISTDDKRWHGDFRLLARNAVAIFVQQPTGPGGRQDALQMDLHQGLRTEFETIAQESLEGRVAILSPGSLWDFGEDGPPRGYVLTSWLDFAQFWSSVSNLRQLNAAATAELLEKCSQYSGFDPPPNKVIKELVGSYYTAQLREYLPEYLKPQGRAS